MTHRVLLVSPHRQDAATLSRMLESAGICCEHISTCEEARVRLAGESYGAVLTDAILADGDWKQVFGLSAGHPEPAPVIVTSLSADERFWTEILDTGCYDLLAQPFDVREVQRIVTLACSQLAAKPAASAQAAGRTVSAAG